MSVINNLSYTYAVYGMGGAEFLQRGNRPPPKSKQIIKFRGNVVSTVVLG